MTHMLHIKHKYFFNVVLDKTIESLLLSNPRNQFIKQKSVVTEAEVWIDHEKKLTSKLLKRHFYNNKIHDYYPT